MRLALFMVLTVMVLLVVGCSLGAKTTTTTQAASGTKWVDLRGKAAQDAPAGAMLFSSARWSASRLRTVRRH